jgi:hypothetical protein
MAGGGVPIFIAWRFFLVVTQNAGIVRSCIRLRFILVRAVTDLKLSQGGVMRRIERLFWLRMNGLLYSAPLGIP